MAEENQVWEGILDDRYRVTVTRTAPDQGQLKIVDTKDDTCLHEEEVSLSYDAIFGPDVADVARWQEIAVEVVDRR